MITGIFVKYDVRNEPETNVITEKIFGIHNFDNYDMVHSRDLIEVKDIYVALKICDFLNVANSKERSFEKADDILEYASKVGYYNKKVSATIINFYDTVFEYLLTTKYTTINNIDTTAFYNLIEHIYNSINDETKEIMNYTSKNIFMEIDITYNAIKLIHENNLV